MTTNADLTQHSVPAATAITETPLSGIHIGALDGVRGIAILLVLAFHFAWAGISQFDLHYRFLSIMTFGWCGVDLFFVLSGFLITGILYDQRHSNHYFRSFYARRILRIFPLYYGALLSVALLKALWWQPQWGSWGTRSPLWLDFYLTNFVIAANGWSAVGDGLAHFWSLAVEEHFYLVWPFLVLLGTRRQLMAAAAALAVFALALRSFLLLSGTTAEAVFVLTPARIDALAIGALCSLAIRGPGGSNILRLAIVAMLSCGFCVLLIVVVRHTLSNYDIVMETLGLTLLALTFGGVILTGVMWQPFKIVLNLGILRWFGRYSYGLYVWHQIIIFILFQPAIRNLLGVQRTTTASTFYILSTFALVMLVSVASYHLWEKPFLSLKKHFP
jgi:peptidoglycan/LPS O-acetylase OafA/YrhL